MPTSDHFFRHRHGPRCVNDEPDDQVAPVEPVVEPIGEDCVTLVKEGSYFWRI